MVVTELELIIGEIEEKIGRGVNKDEKKIDNSNKISFIRSEVELSEMLDDICEKSSEWSAVIHPRTGKGIYARRATLKLKQVPNRLTLYQFKEACHDFLHFYEDKLIAFSRQKSKEPVRQFCHETIKVCTSIDVSGMTDEESGKSMILSDEEKDKEVKKALRQMEKKRKEYSEL
ncbi:unnamed protein product [Thelazia callipaeda]|uniref:DUF3456 domain-containing protein n=1 Tax=Thelazia callipaeda TaxID=103827 RepID=A0A0N5D927_THECL|nr:unnamed protein product [Thelazia callipaeda]